MMMLEHIASYIQKYTSQKLNLVSSQFLESYSSYAVRFMVTSASELMITTLAKPCSITFLW